jgi:hypothetical protein
MHANAISEGYRRMAAIIIAQAAALRPSDVRRSPLPCKYSRATPSWFPAIRSTILKQGNLTPRSTEEKDDEMTIESRMVALERRMTRYRAVTMAMTFLFITIVVMGQDSSSEVISRADELPEDFTNVKFLETDPVRLKPHTIKGDSLAFMKVRLRFTKSGLVIQGDQYQYNHINSLQYNKMSGIKLDVFEDKGQNAAVTASLLAVHPLLAYAVANGTHRVITVEASPDVVRFTASSIEDEYLLLAALQKVTGLPIERNVSGGKDSFQLGDSMYEVIRSQGKPMRAIEFGSTSLLIYAYKTFTVKYVFEKGRLEQIR